MKARKIRCLCLWCEDHFHPFKGESPDRYHEDFSVPCYDGEHQMSRVDHLQVQVRSQINGRDFILVFVRNEDGNSGCDAQTMNKTGTYQTEELVQHALGRQRATC